MDPLTLAKAIEEELALYQALGLRHVPVVKAGPPAGAPDDHATLLADIRKFAAELGRLPFLPDRFTGHTLMAVVDLPVSENDRAAAFRPAEYELLRKMISAIEIDPAKCYVTTLVKAVPQEDDDLAAMLEASRRFFATELAAVRPTALLALGERAGHWLLDCEDPLDLMRRKRRAIDGVAAVITHHPAQILADERTKRPAWEDMKRLAGYLK